MLFFALVIRSLHRHVHTRLATSPKHHPVLAGLTLAGTCLLLFILCMDCAAINYYQKNEHEYIKEDVGGEFNLFILWFTFVLDVAVLILLHIPCMLYLCCTQVYKDNLLCCNKVSKCLLETGIPIITKLYFYVIFGNEMQGKIWKVDHEKSTDDATASTAQKTLVWVVTGMMVAPLFALASHAGYILIAWVTDPVTTTASFFVGLGSFIYLFFVFRQCYTTYKDADENDRGLFRPCVGCSSDEEKHIIQFLTCKKYWIFVVFPFYPLWAMSSHVVNACFIWYCCKGKAGPENEDSGPQDQEGQNPPQEGQNPPQEGQNPPQEGQNPPQEGQNPPQEGQNPPQEGQNPPQEGQNPPQEGQNPRDQEGDSQDSPNAGGARELDWVDLDNGIQSEDTFSIKAFCMSCSWGWLVVGSLAFFLSAFFVIPLPTVRLAEYIENTIQILIVVLAFLITYKVFTVEATDVQKFMRSFRHATKDEADAPNLADDDAEAAGAKAGRLVKTLMKRFEDPNVSISNPEDSTGKLQET